MGRRVQSCKRVAVLRALLAGAWVAAAAAAVAQLGEQGRVSSFDDPGTRSWIRFHNVQLTEEGLTYFHEEGAPAPPSHLRDIVANQYWDQPERTLNVRVVTAHNRSSVPERCTRWVDKPTFLYASPEVDGTHIYHFFFDNICLFFRTAIESGILDLDAFWHRQELPSSQEAPLQIIHRRPGSMASKFRTLFDHITPDRALYPNGVGACYSQLVLGIDNSLRTYALIQDASLQASQQHWMALFQAYAIKAQYRSETLRYGSAPVRQTLQPLSQRRASIGWISRPMSKYNSRAVVNEAEVTEALRARYASSADVHVLRFDGSLTHAMDAVHAVDVLIGMHGAGLTNVLWMRPGAAVVQMTPYGWDIDEPYWRRGAGGKIGEEGKYQATDIIAQMVLNMNCSQHLWVNKKAEHAYFVQHDFEVVGQKFRPHPDPDEPIPGNLWLKNAGTLVPRYWMFQDTWVDVDTLAPVIDEALQAVRGRL